MAKPKAIPKAPKRIVSPQEKQRRYYVIRDFLAQGWRGAELYRHAKNVLDIGPAKVRKLIDHINTREAKQSAFVADVEVNASRELDQINEAIRLLLRESRDIKDSKGVVTHKGQLDKNNYIKLLTLRAKITGSIKAADQIRQKRGRSTAYLGQTFDDDLAGGPDLAGGEDEEGGIKEE